ncbi:MAG: hypothetical protein ACJ8GO_10240 [Ramlibacter sp.]
MRTAQPLHFEDSDFDWDALGSPARREQEDTETDRLAWAVLVLLAFGPPLGFALAAVWR